MKRFLALPLALAVLLMLAACGTSPAQGGEETSAEPTTETTTQEETSAVTLFSIPALPGVAAETTGVTMPVIATPPPATRMTTTRTAPAPSSPATAGSTAATTTKATPVTTSATATATTTTTTATTATTTTTTTTTTTAATKAPRTWTISLSTIRALGLAEVRKTVTTLNSFGTIKSYDISGPKLKDVLAALGADMSAINGRSTLKAICGNPSDPASADYNYFLINSNDSILALTVNGTEDDAPRLFPAVEAGSAHADSGKAVKMVDTLILSYN